MVRAAAVSLVRYDQVQPVFLGRDAAGILDAERQHNPHRLATL
jgi:hypothetical protein